ncbi:hypothetical protein CC80DRAFT_539850 [Byssothecium circinans]|uniref:Uncharacterized protein n=1 Tax=Byssothecium circinans TaxID=147558 RepID=A0A6A5TBL3_9PLEO|nr:hypothetical protein CC80DRAFT_539850 [Byssothecium circinans]
MASAIAKPHGILRRLLLGSWADEREDIPFDPALRPGQMRRKIYSLHTSPSSRWSFDIGDDSHGAYDPRKERLLRGTHDMKGTRARYREDGTGIEDATKPLSGGTDRHHTWRRSATLPMSIGTVPVTAIPDTGSDENAISSDFAKEIGLQIENNTSSPVTFQPANGRSIKSSGIASTTCFFGKGLNKQPKTSIFFNVFPKLAVPVLIGRVFLQATETLTKHIDRLEVSHCPPSVLPRILHLNRPQQRLRCYLNVNLAYANADTGAEMNLASPEFAAQRGFQIEKPDAEHQEVELADGSRAPISGQFRARFDTFDRPSRDGLRPRPHEVYFYILDNLTTDVLLCGDLLFEISAFSDQQNSFVDLDCLGIFSDLNLVKWPSRLEKRLLRIPRSQPSASTAPAGVTSGLAPKDSLAALEVAFVLELDDDDAREQYRRQSADRGISYLSEPDKSRKRALEDTRRQLYDENYVKRLQEHNVRMAAMKLQNRAASNASGSTP